MTSTSDSPYAAWIGRSEQTTERFECKSGQADCRDVERSRLLLRASRCLHSGTGHSSSLRWKRRGLAKMVIPRGAAFCRRRTTAIGCGQADGSSSIEALMVDAQATRTTTVLNIEEKSGRTGSLLFATLRHDYVQDGRLAIREEQDIVYREPTPPKLDSGEALAPARLAGIDYPDPDPVVSLQRRDLQRSPHSLRLALRHRSRRLSRPGGARAVDRHPQPARLLAAPTRRRDFGVLNIAASAR